MQCDLGNHEVSGVLYTLSIPGLPPFACLACLQARELWCQRHRRVFHGFIDGTAACFLCIEERAERSEARGGQFLQEIAPGLSPEEREQLDDWLATSIAITGQSRERCFTRALASKAQRLKISVAAVIQMVREQSSIRPIFT